MAKQKYIVIPLDDSVIAGLPSKEKLYTVWDKRLIDFGVVVHPSCERTYIVSVKRDEKLCRVRLGFVKDMGYENAKLLALQQMQESKSPKPPAPILRDFVQEVWKPHQWKSVKPSTQRAISLSLRVILPIFGSEPINAIPRADIVRWFDKYSETSPGGANTYLNALAQIFNFAVARGIIDKNPTQGIRRNKGRKMTRFLSHEEIERLHEVMEQSCNHRQERDIIRLLLLTGCRKGEILNLRWSEVDGTFLRLTDSKTGPRVVYLNQQAQAIIGEQERSESPFVFPSPYDCSKPRNSVQSFWHEVRKEAGLEDVRLHDLRHTFASHAIMQGIPLPTVAKLLGHKKLSMTMRYAHVSNQVAETSAKKIGASITDWLNNE